MQSAHSGMSTGNNVTSLAHTDHSAAKTHYWASGVHGQAAQWDRIF